jgi:hypothetical protein
MKLNLTRLLELIWGYYWGLVDVCLSPCYDKVKAFSHKIVATLLTFILLTVLVSYVPSVIGNILTESSLCFQKVARNSGCRLLYNCLPCIMASLLFTYPRPLLGAEEVCGSHWQLATAIYHEGDSLILWISRVYEVITMCSGVCWGLQSAALSKHKLYWGIWPSCTKGDHSHSSCLLFL